MKKNSESLSNRSISGTVDSKKTPPEESSFKVGNPTKISAPKLESSNKDINGEVINDTFCFLIVCPTHKKVAVAVGSHRTALWMPFIYITPTTTWRQAITEGVATILSGKDKNTLDKLKNISKPKQAFDSKILEVFRIQLPKTLRIITRVICLIVLKNLGNLSQNSCPKHIKTERIEWIELDKLAKCEFWGPEVGLSKVKFDKWQKDAANVDSYQEFKEFFIEDVYQYYGRTPAKNLEEWMLSSLQINEQVVDRLFTDYFEHCFPSFYMSKTSFCEYICKYGLERNQKKLNNLFNAFNFQRNGYLSFHEVLLGLAAIDPKAPNIESRFKFVFRFFDSDHNGWLNEKEFRSLIKDLNKADTDDLIEQKVKDNMKRMKATDKGVDYEGFRKGITNKDQNLQFRGTSTLCRASTQLFGVIVKAMLERHEDTTKQKEMKNIITEYVSRKKYTGICENCKKQENSVSLHWVTLTPDGLFSGAQEINESEIY